MAVTRSLRGVMDNWGMALGAKGEWKTGAAEPRDPSLALQLLIHTGQVPVEDQVLLRGPVIHPQVRRHRE